MTAVAPRSTTSAARTSATSAPGAGFVLAPLAVAVVAAAGVAAMDAVFVRTATGQYADTTAMRGGDVHHARVVEVLSRTLNGTTLVTLVLVCLVAAGVGVLRRRVDLAIGAGLLVLGANASCRLLKTRLPRPDLSDFPGPNSFPSGHTAAAASVAFALILVLPAAVRGIVALAGAGYVTVIGVATVWAEWHRPSDVAAAVLLVLAWAAFALFVTRLFRRVAVPGDRPSRLVTVPLLAVFLVTGAAGVLGLISVAMNVRMSAALVSSRFAFLAGSAGIAAAVAGGFLIWVWLAARGSAPTSAGRPARRAKGGEK
ncbi:phosphatase PAP2 family protein [Paractinoplanes rhizophilus]|jgi:membrane-associated phospholipid phosphatase|uniref:Phosphatase PAP2 family protein n=1 Tax=Paractinoplanes rhizophilus TaxID=1416877 RepID=A0ABW2HN49_9ACTN|nr:phosphatase PAP2 family protein [Actinoplanes sp.]